MEHVLLGTNCPPPFLGLRVQFAEVEEQIEEEEENPLLVPLEEKSVLQEEQASLWFSKVRSWGSG